MGGVNPYIDKPKTERPEKKFRVTFLIEETGERKIFEVNPPDLPYGRTGLEGSVLDIAEGAGLEIDHACGGVCACATCHVLVPPEWAARVPAIGPAENDLLECTAVPRTAQSRLSCQIQVSAALDGLTVNLPERQS